MITSQISAFETEIQAAIELAPISLGNTPDNWRIGFNLALYNLVGGNVAETEEQYDRLVSTCTFLPSLQDALDDLTNYLTIQSSNKLAQNIRTQLQTRVDELKQSSTE
jgi:hypothetical protein